jgi:hypothetical protein
VSPVTNAETGDGPRNDDLGASVYASYILRCWMSKSGQVRVRLVDVSSGTSHPMTDLNALPDFLRRLIAEQHPDKE